MITYDIIAQDHQIFVNSVVDAFIAEYYESYPERTQQNMEEFFNSHQKKLKEELAGNATEAFHKMIQAGLPSDLGFIAKIQRINLEGATTFMGKLLGKIN